MAVTLPTRNLSVLPSTLTHRSNELVIVTTIQDSYTEHVEIMKALGATLAPAVAARYEAPPRSPRSRESVAESKGIRNPTLEIVMDPRRMAVSDGIDATASALRQASALLRPHIDTLQQAVARWEGQEGSPA